MKETVGMPGHRNMPWYSSPPATSYGNGMMITFDLLGTSLSTIEAGDVELSTPTRLKSLSAMRARLLSKRATPSTFSSVGSRAVIEGRTTVLETGTTPIADRLEG